MLPILGRLLGMEYCENQYGIVLNMIQNAVRESFQGPPAHFMFVPLHRQRSGGDGLHRSLYSGLEPARQICIDFTVVGFFSTDVFTRGLKKLYRLQRSSARSSEKTSSAGIAFSSPRRYAW